MANFYNELSDELQNFIAQQPLFFVATAAANGRINLSPKGMDTFRCLSAKETAYLDLTGSGNETSAHLKNNGRITIMFCSFSKNPQILRLYGKGQVVRPHHARWPNLIQHFAQLPGARQIIHLTIDSVQTSCGFAVPHMHLDSERPTLKQWAEKKGPEGIETYWQEKNQTSIDGLPTGINDE